MTLRKRIQKEIEANRTNAAQAAVAVCLLLEDEIGLDGNGWFDDDPELRAQLGSGSRD